MAAVCATHRFRSSGERLLFGAFPPLDAAEMNDKVCPIAVIHRRPPGTSVWVSLAFVWHRRSLKRYG